MSKQTSKSLILDIINLYNKYPEAVEKAIALMKELDPGQEKENRGRITPTSLEIEPVEDGSRFGLTVFELDRPSEYNPNINVGEPVPYITNFSFSSKMDEKTISGTITRRRSVDTSFAHSDSFIGFDSLYNAFTIHRDNAFSPRKLNLRFIIQHPEEETNIHRDLFGMILTNYTTKMVGDVIVDRFEFKADELTPWIQ